MKALWLYRTAAILFVLFAAGHTMGFLTFTATTPEGRAVFDAMNSVHFTQRSGTYSYGNFYRGFGLSCTVSMLLSAYLAWHLGQLSRTLPQAIGALGWVFAWVQIAGLWLSTRYFGGPPAVFSALLIITLGWAAWLVSAQARSISQEVSSG
jgi:hypothetical protein